MRPDVDFEVSGLGWARIIVGGAVIITVACGYGIGALVHWLLT